jgi:hypothetical protein
LKEASEDGCKPEIVAAAFWNPPNRRIELYHVFMLLKSGVLAVLANWGLNGLLVRLPPHPGLVDSCHSLTSAV